MSVAAPATAPQPRILVHPLRASVREIAVIIGDEVLTLDQWITRPPRS